MTVLDSFSITTNDTVWSSSSLLSCSFIAALSTKCRLRCSPHFASVPCPPPSDAWVGNLTLPQCCTFYQVPPEVITSFCLSPVPPPSATWGGNHTLSQFLAPPNATWGGHLTLSKCHLPQLPPDVVSSLCLGGAPHQAPPEVIISLYLSTLSPPTKCCLRWLFHCSLLAICPDYNF